MDYSGHSESHTLRNGIVVRLPISVLLLLCTQLVLVKRFKLHRRILDRS